MKFGSRPRNHEHIFIVQISTINHKKKKIKNTALIFTQQSEMRLIVVSNTWSISLQWCNLEGQQNL